jgi:mono/diheme cytochrome c family protein
MVAAGQQVFSGPGTCFACHGANGAGTPLAPALNDGTWLNIDGSYDALVQVITNGVPVPQQAAVPMAPRGGSAITDEQVREVAAYVYSISRQ